MRHEIDQLRAHARRDLERFCQPNHYLLRDHDPAADIELTTRLLQSPAQLQLTAREIAAATALNHLATFEKRSRTIWGDFDVARDVGSKVLVKDIPASENGEVVARFETIYPADIPATQAAEITSRLEMFRQSALSYTHIIAEPYLIKAFKQAAPATEAAKVEAEINTTPSDDIPGKLPNTNIG